MHVAADEQPAFGIYKAISCLEEERGQLTNIISTNLIVTTEVAGIRVGRIMLA